MSGLMNLIMSKNKMVKTRGLCNNPLFHFLAVSDAVCCPEQDMNREY